MWEFSLAISEMAFREKDLMVFQMQISKSRATVPLTRDYITQWEHSYGEDAVLMG
jgi:cyclopropane-fatty-acyl-phospholipid synthase